MFLFSCAMLYPWNRIEDVSFFIFICVSFYKSHRVDILSFPSMFCLSQVCSVLPKYVLSFPSMSKGDRTYREMEQDRYEWDLLSVNRERYKSTYGATDFTRESSHRFQYHSSTTTRRITILLNEVEFYRAASSFSMRNSPPRVIGDGWRIDRWGITSTFWEKIHGLAIIDVEQKGKANSGIDMIDLYESPSEALRDCLSSVSKPIELIEHCTYSKHKYLNVWHGDDRNISSLQWRSILNLSRSNSHSPVVLNLERDSDSSGNHNTPLSFFPNLNSFSCPFTWIFFDERRRSRKWITACSLDFRTRTSWSAKSRWSTPTKGNLFVPVPLFAKAFALFMHLCS